MKGKVIVITEVRWKVTIFAWQANSPEVDLTTSFSHHSGHWYAHFLAFCQLPGCPTFLAGTPYNAWPTGIRTMPIIIAFCLLSQFLIFQRKEILPEIKWIIHHGTPIFFFLQKLLVPLQKQRGGKENLHVCWMFSHINLLNCFALENKLHYFFNRE